MCPKDVLSNHACLPHHGHVPSFVGPPHVPLHVHGRNVWIYFHLPGLQIQGPLPPPNELST